MGTARKLGCSTAPRGAFRSPLIASSREFGLRAAVDGVGIAFAVEEVIAPFVKDGRLVRLPEPWSAPFPGFDLCYSQQRNMAAVLRAFVDAMRLRYRVAIGLHTAQGGDPGEVTV